MPWFPLLILHWLAWTSPVRNCCWAQLLDSKGRDLLFWKSPWLCGLVAIVTRGSRTIVLNVSSDSVLHTPFLEYFICTTTSRNWCWSICRKQILFVSYFLNIFSNHRQRKDSCLCQSFVWYFERRTATTSTEKRQNLRRGCLDPKNMPTSPILRVFRNL